MKKIALIFVSVLAIQAASAQKPRIDPYASIDKKILQIPDSLTKTTDGLASYVTLNFKTNPEKVRAVFTWIAFNIQYDVENAFAINFHEQITEKIPKTLRTKKGICENYAALFQEVCSKSGIKTFVVSGYTEQNGFVDYIPHAWCAALIDGSWFMFDPTWGSGYITDKKFVKRINNAYFKAAPSSFIKSHMPFDPLWQFLNYPLTVQEFYAGKAQENKSKPFFSFPDSINVYEKQSRIDQLLSSAKRIEENGSKNSLIFDKLYHIKLEIENDRQSKIINLYNAATADYNEGIRKLNEFIQYRNKQFTPKKTDDEIQAMIAETTDKFQKARAELGQIEKPDVNTASMMAQFTKSIDDAESQVKEQQSWLKTYLAKGKAGRKSMFYDRKITWFGIPLN